MLMITVLDIITACVVVQWVLAGAFPPVVLLLLVPLAVTAVKMWQDSLQRLAWVRKCCSLLHLGGGMPTHN
jgi:hypothetical protein